VGNISYQQTSWLIGFSMSHGSPISWPLAVGRTSLTGTNHFTGFRRFPFHQLFPNMFSFRLRHCTTNAASQGLTSFGCSPILSKGGHKFSAVFVARNPTQKRSAGTEAQELMPGQLMYIRCMPFKWFSRLFPSSLFRLRGQFWILPHSHPHLFIFQLYITHIQCSPADHLSIPHKKTNHRDTAWLCNLISNWKLCDVQSEAMLASLAEPCPVSSCWVGGPETKRRNIT